MNSKLIFLHALTPVHAGTGQAASVVDLPVAREKATSWPVIPSSTVKGVLRDEVDETTAKRVFGTMEASGRIGLTDQRTLFLAVRSMFGIFAYVTCPYALTRLKRDAASLGCALTLPGIPDVRDDAILVTGDTVLTQNQKVFLEDYDLKTAPLSAELASALSTALFTDREEKVSFESRVAIVSDTIFTFLCETSLEVTAKIALDDTTKNVVNGALWYEEAVPAETIFVGAAVALFPSETLDDLKHLDGTVVQLGGKSTTGKGLCRVKLS